MFTFQPSLTKSFGHLTITLFLLFCLLIPATLVAASQQVDLSLVANTQNVAVGDTFTVSLVMKAGTDAPSIQIQNLPIPGLEKFASRGVSNQTQFQSINGVSVIQYESTHVLVAQEPGTYTIGPVTLPSHTGSSTTSDTLTITVGSAPGSNQLQNSDALENNKEIVPKQNNSAATSQYNTSMLRDGFLWFVLIGLFGYVVYDLYTRKPKDTPTDKSDTKLESTSGSSETSAIDEPSQTPLSTTDTPVSDDSHTATSYDFGALSTITDRSYYQRVIDELGTYIHSITKTPPPTTQVTSDHIRHVLAESTLPQETQEKISAVLAECDVGKYAPEEQARRNKIQSIITTL